MARLLQGFQTGTESQLFVHCATSVTYSAQLEAAVPGVSRYAERALLLAQQQDLVCVPDEVDADYLDYLASLGLGPDPANVIVLSRFGDAETEGPLWYRLLNSAEALRTTSELSRLQCSVHLHPFIATEGQFELARALSRRARLSMRVVGGDPAAVAYADCKHHIRAKALELDVPVAPGEVVDLGSGEGCSEGRCDSLLAAIERQIGRTGRVIVRGSGGAAGSATFIVGDSSQSHEALARALSRRTDNRIYLVESMVQPTVSPSIQIGIDAQRGSIECLGVTDQRLHGAVHAGNVYPSVARCAGQMVQWARILSKWLMKEGYSGIAGFDFVEYNGPDGHPRAFLAELNPRVIAATYPLGVAERLGMPAFVSGTIQTELQSFAELREALSDLLLSPDGGPGVLPYTTGLLEYGKCGLFALSHSRTEATELYAAAESVLGAPCAIS